MKPLLAAVLALALTVGLAAGVGAEETPSPTPTASSDPTPTPTPTPTPEPSPSPTPSPAPAPEPAPAPNPEQSPAPGPAAPAEDPASRLIDETRQRLGAGLADALATQRQLSDALSQNADQQRQLEERVATSQAKLESLQREVERLDAEIAATQGRVDQTRAEIAALARALYQEPDSLLVRLLRAGSLRDVVTETGDLTAAALRADTLKQKLSQDLARLKSDQEARQEAVEEEAQIGLELDSARVELQELAFEMQTTADELLASIEESRSALAGAAGQQPSLTQRIADLLQQRQRALISAAQELVWRQAQIWARLNVRAIPLPSTETARSSGGYRFIWPEQGSAITQGFGPSSLWFEPPMFGFPNFHTGIDIAGGSKTVQAAADGVVAVVGSGTTGYGNYVIVVHADGFVTLYGHLSQSLVTVGTVVTRGQRIGIEGSTGMSTGPHLHFELRLNGQPVDPLPYLPPLGSA